MLCSVAACCRVQAASLRWSIPNCDKFANPQPPRAWGTMARASLSTTFIIVASNFVMLTLVYYMFMATHHSYAAKGGGGGGEVTTQHLARIQQQLQDINALQQQAPQVQLPGQSTGPVSATCPPCVQTPCPTAAQASPASTCECPECPVCVDTPCPACSPMPSPSSVAPKRRTAVLGLAKGLKLVDAYRFSRSFREAAPDADLVIFTDETSGEVADVYKTFGAKVVLYKESDLGAAGSYHPSSYRWILMDKWLRALPESERYDAVMFCDTRDAVFQSDPFVHVKEDAFYATLEQRPKTIQQCGWNRKWVSDCFGQSVLRKVGDNVISCSGTSLATWGPALEYTGLMRNEIQGNSCERNGVDQGMHNVFVHDRRLKSRIIIWDNEDGPIATVQSMPKLKRDMYGRLLNRNGGLAVEACAGASCSRPNPCVGAQVKCTQWCTSTTAAKR